MKHQFYFTGYSDDVVLAGHDERSFVEAFLQAMKAGGTIKI